MRLKIWLCTGIIVTIVGGLVSPVTWSQDMKSLQGYWRWLISRNGKQNSVAQLATAQSGTVRECDAPTELNHWVHNSFLYNYNNPLANLQTMGDGTAAHNFWDVMRRAGEQTRHMLINDAAKLWGVSIDDCGARNSVVTHAGIGKPATFGELASAAAFEMPPQVPSLKTPDQFRLIGATLQHLDSRLKVRGEAIHGEDDLPPRMVVIGWIGKLNHPTGKNSVVLLLP